MRKRVFIPTVSLGQDHHIDLLEFSVDEASWFSRSKFTSLEGCRLDVAIELADKALSQLPKPKQKSRLFLVNPAPYLSNAKGVALGLLLGLYLQERQCPHQTLIVTGILDFSTDNQNCLISDSGYLDLKLSAAISLGVQVEPTPFLIPAPVELKPAILEELTRLNICVFPIKTVIEALQICFAPLSSASSSLRGSA